MAGGTRRITVCKLGGKKRKAPQQSEEKKNESLSLSRYPLSLSFLLHIFQSKTQNKSIWTRTFLKVSQKRARHVCMDLSSSFLPEIFNQMMTALPCTGLSKQRQRNLLSCSINPSPRNSTTGPISHSLSNHPTICVHPTLTILQGTDQVCPFGMTSHANVVRPLSRGLLHCMFKKLRAI